MWKRWTKPGKADNAIPNEQKDTNGKLGIPGFEMITFSELEQEPELYEIEDSGLQKELCKIFPESRPIFLRSVHGIILYVLNLMKCTGEHCQ